MGLTLREGCDFPDEVGTLFSEYTQMLIDGDPGFRDYLAVQHYDDELDHLDRKYGRPAGRLYLADWDGVLAGCVGLRRLDDIRCEMKRLYVRPAFRGRHIAQTLVERLLEEAKGMGYRTVLLDTLPFLESALGLYRKLGFYDIPCYNDSPMETSVYLRKDL